MQSLSHRWIPLSDHQTPAMFEWIKRRTFLRRSLSRPLLLLPLTNFGKVLLLMALLLMVVRATSLHRLRGALLALQISAKNSLDWFHCNTDNRYLTLLTSNSTVDLSLAFPMCHLRLSINTCSKLPSTTLSHTITLKIGGISQCVCVCGVSLSPSPQLKWFSCDHCVQCSSACNPYFPALTCDRLSVVGKVKTTVGERECLCGCELGWLDVWGEWCAFDYSRSRLQSCWQS